MIFETENIEFKSKVTDDIYKEVIAFANTDGGVIYIGFDDKGNAVGIDNVDETYTRITNGIRDAIQPDVTMFIKYTLQDNRVVKIAVGEGSYKPYYLKSKGLKPSGVYIRQGASSVQASPEQIRQLIKESDGDVFEDMRSIEQDLTFNKTADAFKKYKIEFGKEKFRVLGITDSSDSLYTNLAQIISDQCAHTTKVAVFGNDTNTEFRDSKEFGGSIFAQLDEAFSYLMLCNKTTATFKGLERVERADYPEGALREALLNAIVHRDYSFSGSIIININDNEMEFISIGGLLPGLSPDDIRSGISQPRNKKLAEIFHRLHLIESYGTGIRKIYSLYKDQAVQPRIEVTSNTFKFVLPNMNSSANIEGTANAKAITPQMQKILTFIEDNGQITDGEIEELLQIKGTRRYNLVKQMEADGLIVVKGRGINKVYLKI
ncbi:MAG: putative DNA binding domain-containing protein [Clostridia bacterium]|nr:putative DNA binding domain-containing protein [Clostridia bacterium]